jgi:hypothetical protein
MLAVLLEASVHLEVDRLHSLGLEWLIQQLQGRLMKGTPTRLCLLQCPFMLFCPPKYSSFPVL